jgi:hypothetical protein
MQFKSFRKGVSMQSNTATVGNQPVNFTNISVENRKPDPFTIADGHYVGHDGFVVPKNFDEFHERFPQYVRNWVKRHVDRSAPKEDVEDWTQDLTVHLKYLPATSKHREAGKEDIVQTFDPHKHHGANQARFQSYINLCLGNKFRTIHSARMKNPLCRSGNVSLTTHTEYADRDQGGDEYCHSNSQFLRRRCEREEKQQHDKQLITEFVNFVQSEDSSVLTAMGAIAAVGNSKAAAELLGTTNTEFCRMRSRLRQLGRCFLDGEAVPKRRRRYSKRGNRAVPPTPLRFTES